MLPLYLINVLGLDVMGAGPVLAAMAVGAFLSGAAARHVVGRVGAPGTVLIGLGLRLASAQLRAQGTHSRLGEHTGAAVDALTAGFADATRWALLLAAVFLALGFIGALRVRRAAAVPAS